MAQWKVIESHPNYEISSMGGVRNARTGRYLTPYDDGQGYLRVKLDGEKWSYATGNTKNTGR